MKLDKALQQELVQGINADDPWACVRNASPEMLEMGKQISHHFRSLNDPQGFIGFREQIADIICDNYEDIKDDIKLPEEDEADVAQLYEQVEEEWLLPKEMLRNLYLSLNLLPARLDRLPYAAHAQGVLDQETLPRKPWAKPGELTKPVATDLAVSLTLLLHLYDRSIRQASRLASACFGLSECHVYRGAQKRKKRIEKQSPTDDWRELDVWIFWSRLWQGLKRQLVNPDIVIALFLPNSGRKDLQDNCRTTAQAFVKLLGDMVSETAAVFTEEQAQALEISPEEILAISNAAELPDLQEQLSLVPRAIDLLRVFSMFEMVRHMHPESARQLEIKYFGETSSRSIDQASNHTSHNAQH